MPSTVPATRNGAQRASGRRGRGLRLVPVARAPQAVQKRASGSSDAPHCVQNGLDMVGIAVLYQLTAGLPTEGGAR